MVPSWTDSLTWKMFRRVRLATDVKPFYHLLSLCGGGCYPHAHSASLPARDMAAADTSGRGPIDEAWPHPSAVIETCRNSTPFTAQYLFLFGVDGCTALTSRVPALVWRAA